MKLLFSEVLKISKNKISELLMVLLDRCCCCFFFLVKQANWARAVAFCWYIAFPLITIGFLCCIFQLGLQKLSLILIDFYRFSVSLSVNDIFSSSFPLLALPFVEVWNHWTEKNGSTMNEFRFHDRRKTFLFKWFRTSHRGTQLFLGNMF